MPVTADWEDDDKKIIWVNFVGKWTMPEFFETCQQTILPMLDSVDHTVHFFGEINSMYVPQGVLTRFNQLMHIPQLNHKNSGMIVMWGGPSVIDTFGNMFIRVFGQQQKMVMARNEDEARAIVAQYDSKENNSG